MPPFRPIHLTVLSLVVVSVPAAGCATRPATATTAVPAYLVLVEGHADERGTNEYNLALGERRAKAAMNYLVAQGVLAALFIGGIYAVLAARRRDEP